MTKPTKRLRCCSWSSHDSMPSPRFLRATSRAAASDGGYRSVLQLAHRGTQSVTLAGGRIDAETPPHAVADTEFQLRVCLRCVVGGGLEQLVGQRELQDRPERL